MLRHYYIQNFEDGIQIRAYTINKESVAQGRRKHSKSGGTCIHGRPQQQKRALCKSKRGTLYANL